MFRLVELLYLMSLSVIKISASMGFQVQVNNTDAEGRLTLADALVYACNQGVDKVLFLEKLMYSSNRIGLLRVSFLF